MVLTTGVKTDGRNSVLEGSTCPTSLQGDCKEAGRQRSLSVGGDGSLGGGDGSPGSGSLSLDSNGSLSDDGASAARGTTTAVERVRG